jgi:TolB-like protein/Flp pilus assembly protein TadD
MPRFSTLLEELRRRPILQALGIYVVASWGVLQVVDTLTSALALPDWFPPFALALLVVGFPFVLTTAILGGRPGEPLLAGRGGKGSRPATADLADDPRSHAGWTRALTWRNAAIGGVLAMSLWGVVAAGWIAFGGRTVTPPAGPPRETVAVLPFENMSADPDNQYLAGGFHEEVLTQLARIGGLHVLARNTMLRYAGVVSPREVGLELNAGSILEGSVQRVGDRIRVTVQLIDATTERHVWAERYDRGMEDVFAVQTDIALRVADALRATLSPAEAERLERRLTADIQAYELYLRGVDYARRGYGESHFRNAMAMFGRAIEIDPTFARAYAGLGEAALGLYWFGFDRTQERFDQGRAAAEMAYRLDPDDPAVLRAISDVHYRSLDHEQALTYIRRGLDRNPGDGDLLLRLGAVYRRTGRVAASEPPFRQALSLDPLSATRAMDLGATYALLRRFEEAESMLERAIALAPDQGNVPYQLLVNVQLARDGDVAAARRVIGRSPDQDSPVLRGTLAGLDLMEGRYQQGLDRLDGLPPVIVSQDALVPAHLLRGHLLAAMGREREAHVRYDSARVTLEELIRERPGDARVRASLGIAYAYLDREADALQEARQAMDLVPWETDYVMAGLRAVDRAHVLTRVGHHEEAIEQIRAVLDEAALFTPRTFLDSPFFRPLRSHPSFQDLIAGS